MTSLAAWGFDDFFASAVGTLDEGAVVARVAAKKRESLAVDQVILEFE